MASTGILLSLCVLFLQMTRLELKECPDLKVAEIGFNYVHFLGELHRVKSLHFARTRQGLLIGTRFYFEETFVNGSLPAITGIVPLLEEDGFQVRIWYSNFTQISILIFETIS